MAFIFFSPLGSPVKSCKSPLKRTIVPGSFYGKKTAVYLTPLERKAVKESLPSPPPLPLPSPPTQKTKGKKKKNAAGSKKPGKAAAESKKPEKTFSTTIKPIKLSKMSNRFALKSSQSLISCNCRLLRVRILVFFHHCSLLFLFS